MLLGGTCIYIYFLFSLSLSLSDGHIRHAQPYNSQGWWRHLGEAEAYPLNDISQGRREGYPLAGRGRTAALDMTARSTNGKFSAIHWPLFQYFPCITFESGSLVPRRGQGQITE